MGIVGIRCFRLLGTKSMSCDHIAMSAILTNACFIPSSPTLWKCDAKSLARAVINPNYLLTPRVGEEVGGQIGTSFCRFDWSRLSCRAPPRQGQPVKCFKIIKTFKVAIKFNVASD